MPAIEIGRVCVKTAGREAGQKCAIVEVIDDKFVEIVGANIKNRRCNIRHLEPLDETVEVSENVDDVTKQLE